MSMFIQTVTQLNKRGAVAELDEAMSSAVQQVRRTGKPAEITYKIKIKPVDAEGEQVQVTDSISVKTAQPMRKAATFFTTDDGKITREDPSQKELPFKAVQGGAAASPSADTTTPAAAAS